MPGASILDFFDRYGLDAISWTSPLLPNSERGEFAASDPDGIERIQSDAWRIEVEAIPTPISGREGIL